MIFVKTELLPFFITFLFLFFTKGTKRIVSFFFMPHVENNEETVKENLKKKQVRKISTFLYLVLVNLPM